MKLAWQEPPVPQRSRPSFQDVPSSTSRREKHSVLGILMDAIDYEGAVQQIISAGRAREGIAVSAIAVHGLMTGVLDPEHKYRLNRFDLLLPDGQPVRWMLNLSYKAGLNDRVYGPRLTLLTCERAAKENLPVFFYGSTPPVLTRMVKNLKERFPNLVIAGAESSKFRRLDQQEKTYLVQKIHKSGARIVFIGLGCPRQEVWAYEFREAVSLPLLAVGAAFPFIAGELRQAPKDLQDLGLEWLFRLSMEPRRLWRRYLLLNPSYVLLAALQICGIKNFSTCGRKPDAELLYG